LDKGERRSEEIKDHLILAEECLEEAKNLLSNGFYRGAVSRAYYSMYHAAKALLLTKNIAPKKHAGVLRMLGLEFVNKGYLEEVYAEAYKFAFDIRQKADYGIEFKIEKETAEEVVKNAEIFLQRVIKAIEEFESF